jgi:hypothetical protein
LAQPSFIIGIDLGTTNSVVAFADAAPGKPGGAEIQLFRVPQQVAPGTEEKRTLLPSFLLVTGSGEDPEPGSALPWDDSRHVVVGEYARDRGAEIPDRLISSSKSWLCNKMVDRNHPLLPWQSANTSAKLSPVEASAAILSHIRKAWNREMAADNEALQMQYQEVLITVPASFDAVARDLTVKAAAMAGLENITLLEEPQAAVYAWIADSGDTWRRQIQKDDRILVFDIGGGTCDMSLIQVVDKDGKLALERIAVGDHLLVGGDNMDLALAHFVAAGLTADGTRLDRWQMRGLWHSCRSAKEALLADAGNGSHPVTVLGRGSRLIGGSIHTEVSENQVTTVLFDGFFPVCTLSDRPERPPVAGLREIGLAYEADPAVTRHLAEFLSRQKTPDGRPLPMPNAVLFNGGVMKPEKLRYRIMSMLKDWQAGETKSDVREIITKSFDLSVARGAVYYGAARRGEGIRIRSGLGRSYYLGIAAAMPAVPGLPPPIKALCVAPFGMEEGTAAILPEREFALVVGEPVVFDFLGSAVRQTDTMGDVVEDWETDIDPITTIETVLDGQSGSVIPVTLHVKATEVGTLELWCVAKEGTGRWKLAFNVREQSD